MKGEILGAMAHPTYRDYADSIYESGRHLLNLINEILDLSRIEAGRYELHEEPVRLADVVEECLRLLTLRAQSKGLHVAFELDKELGQLWADERAIRQICLNLITNALKFTPRGGSVTITIASTPEGGQTLIVKDTGPGIPTEEIPKVMQAFGQGSLAHQTAEGGTGLGLPIVQNLVTLHGGPFELRSELRKGTEAIVVLPPSRVLRAMPPLQPLGQERHRRPMERPRHTREPQWRQRAGEVVN
jgi:two-component system cell cycle sensor histidine kinase PleC